MGGEFCLGIRAKINDEVKEISLVLPTTAFVETLTSPDLFVTKKLLKYIFTNKWPAEGESKASIYEIPEIRPHGYGVVLLDFVTREAFSRQNFSKPLEMFLTSSSPATDRNKVERLAEAGIDVDEILEHKGNQWKPMSKARRQRIIKEAREIIGNEERFDGRFESFKGFVQVQFDFGMKLNHNAKHAAICFDEVKKFMKKNGWEKRAKAPSNEE